MKGWTQVIAICVTALISCSFTTATSTTAAAAPNWTEIQATALVGLDDDVTRKIASDGHFDGISISEVRFLENGFDWHLILFVSTTKPDGPNWVVPHDDENAAFDAMIAALQKYGGSGIAVNSGSGSARRQSGDGTCGVQPSRIKACDPNRNFDARAPLFTAVFVSQFKLHQPVIALHTNSHGFNGDGAGGRGDVTIYDRTAFARGEIRPRRYGVLATRPSPDMANPDSFALSAYLASSGAPSSTDKACGKAMAQSGIHYWHEPVRKSDGSLSNYLVLNRRDLAYMNAESRAEIDLSLAARRHAIMIAAYLTQCRALWNEPRPLP